MGSPSGSLVRGQQGILGAGGAGYAQMIHGNENGHLAPDYYA